MFLISIWNDFPSVQLTEALKKKKSTFIMEVPAQCNVKLQL